jgi:hypothetical protein
MLVTKRKTIERMLDVNKIKNHGESLLLKNIPFKRLVAYQDIKNMNMVNGISTREL